MNYSTAVEINMANNERNAMMEDGLLNNGDVTEHAAIASFAVRVLRENRDCTRDSIRDYCSRSGIYF